MLCSAEKDWELRGPLEAYSKQVWGMGGTGPQPTLNEDGWGGKEKVEAGFMKKQRLKSNRVGNALGPWALCSAPLRPSLEFSRETPSPLP